MTPMFENEFTDANEPICPVCKVPIIADFGKTSGAYMTKQQAWLIHHDCAKTFIDDMQTR